MTELYLILAVYRAFTLNQSSRILRTLGTQAAALALMMTSWSIVLANLVGTVVAFPVGAGLADRIKPFVLNTPAVIAAVAGALLLRAAWSQGTRPVNGPLSVHNTRSAFCRVSRYAHWVVGTLILVLLPMGLFTWVLGAHHPEHGAFLGMHQTLGLTVLLLVVLRVLWLGQSPAQRQLALVTHRGLSALMLNFPVTGILLTAWRGDAMDIYGWSVAGLLTPDAHFGAAAGVVHNLVLPAMFYLPLFAHLGAVTKHHFIDRRPQDIRRMLR